MSFRSKLIGTWECLYWRAIKINDETDIAYPYSENINGNIMYSQDGYMAAMLQRPDVPKYTPGPLKGTPEQYQQAGAKTQSYHGPFFLDEKEDGTVKLFHHMIVSLPANWIGETQVRWCEMWEEGGRLFMKLGPGYNFTTEDGIERRVEVGWRKREPNTRTTPP